MISKRPVNYDLNIGYACNAACRYCNRLIDEFRLPNASMTIAQVGTAIERWKAAGVTIKKLKVSGGEPSLHPDLVPIVQLLLDSGIVQTVWVLSNGIKQDLPKLPRGARYRVDPILDPKDGWKNHQPFLISPADVGIEADGSECSTRRMCGRGVEAFGFSQCGIAGALGHLLGIDPYHEKPVLHISHPEICKHCLYSLPDAKQKELQRKCPPGGKWPDGSTFGDSTIDYPTPTFKAALERRKTQPTFFARGLDDDVQVPSTQRADGQHLQGE